MASLEGWSSTIELHPRALEFQNLRSLEQRPLRPSVWECPQRFLTAPVGSRSLMNWLKTFTLVWSPTSCFAPCIQKI